MFESEMDEYHIGSPKVMLVVRFEAETIGRIRSCYCGSIPLIISFL